MPRPKRVAAVAAAAKLSGDDPSYDSEGIFEAYFDHDDGGDKFPCRVKASGKGDGFYTAIFLKQDMNTGEWLPDGGDKTVGVHFDPKKGAGHGIWPLVDQSVEDYSNRKKNSKVAKVVAKVHDDYDTMKAKGTLPTIGQVRKALKERNLPAGGSVRAMLERLHGHGTCHPLLHLPHSHYHLSRGSRRSPSINDCYRRH